MEKFDDGILTDRVTGTGSGTGTEPETEMQAEAGTGMEAEAGEEASLADILDLEEDEKQDEDDTEKLELFKRIAEQGGEDADMAARLVGMHYLKEGRDQDLSEAIYWFEKSRDAFAMVYIAKIYEDEGEKELSMEYNERALQAETDTEGTMRSNAAMSLTIYWMAKDPARAEAYFAKARELGLADNFAAMEGSIAAALGKIYEYQKNQERAIYWYFEAVKEEDSEENRKALNRAAGEVLQQGPGENADLWKGADEAMEYLAEKGDTYALMVVFYYWNKNKEAEGNPEKFTYWLQKTADAGQDYPCLLLANEYLTGEGNRTGLARDLKKARYYFDCCKGELAKTNADLVAKFEKSLSARERQAGITGEGSASGEGTDAGADGEISARQNEAAPEEVSGSREAFSDSSSDHSSDSFSDVSSGSEEPLPKNGMKKWLIIAAVGLFIFPPLTLIGLFMAWKENKKYKEKIRR